MGQGDWWPEDVGVNPWGTLRMGDPDYPYEIAFNWGTWCWLAHWGINGGHEATGLAPTTQVNDKAILLQAAKLHAGTSALDDASFAIGAAQLRDVPLALEAVAHKAVAFSASIGVRGNSTIGIDLSANTFSSPSAAKARDSNHVLPSLAVDEVFNVGDILARLQAEKIPN